MLLAAINAYPLSALLQISLSHSHTTISFQVLFALLRRDEFKLSVFFQSRSCTANEGPVGIQYRCMVLIYVFPEMKLLFPKQNYNVLLLVPTLIYLWLWEIYMFPGSVCLFCYREICGPILGICKFLTDTWMWKLGLQFPEKEYINVIFLAVCHTFSVLLWSSIPWEICKPSARGAFKRGSTPRRDLCFALCTAEKIIPRTHRATYSPLAVGLGGLVLHRCGGGGGG